MKAATSMKDALAAFLSAVVSFPYAKALYVAIIACVIVVLAREIYIVLFDRTIYVGKFDYFSDGKASENEAKTFPSYILGQYRLLRTALKEEEKQRAKAQAENKNGGFELNRQLPTSLPELYAWTSSLADAEIKIQGFDIGKTLTFLRAWVAPPAEITGFVEKSSSGTRVLVSWPATGKNSDEAGQSFDTGLLSSDGSAAFAVAACIVWADAAATDGHFQKIPRSVFVYWALAWWDYRILVSRAAAAQDFTAEDKKHWKQARALADKLIPNAKEFDEIWRLRADIIDIAPKMVGPEGVYATQAERDTDQQLAKQDKLNFASNSTIPNLITTLTNLFFSNADTKKAIDALQKSSTEPTPAYPGHPVWVRASGPSEKQGVLSPSGDVAVTATAIVVQDGVKKLLLPDYVVTNNSNAISFEIRMSPNGPVVAYAKKGDLAAVGDLPDKIGNGVLLAPLVGDGSNIISTSGGSTSLTKVAGIPAVGSELKLIAAGGQKDAKLTSTKEGFAVVSPRITAPGLGGAPILDENGSLVAMAYSGSDQESQLLPLKQLFEAHGLKLR